MDRASRETTTSAAFVVLAALAVLSVAQHVPDGAPAFALVLFGTCAILGAAFVERVRVDAKHFVAGAGAAYVATAIAVTVLIEPNTPVFFLVTGYLLVGFLSGALAVAIVRRWTVAVGRPVDS